MSYEKSEIKWDDMAENDWLLVLIFINLTISTFFLKKYLLVLFLLCVNITTFVE
jgi:hypothetical protein